MLGGRFTGHPRFGTATVAAPDGRIDLVTARRETYARPGNLPCVARGTIADDLDRRDFSINSMAVALWPSGGGVLDRHGGLDDLESGVVRSLHRRSFVDDPTRMMRAVRYEQRFGFCIEQATLADMEACAAAGYMDSVSGERWRHELERVLDENNPGPPLLRSAELGLLAGIHPSLGRAGVKYGGLRRLAALSAESRTSVNSQSDDWLAALFSPLSRLEAESCIQRLRLSGRRAAVARDTIAVREMEPAIKAASRQPSELTRVLSGLDPAAVLGWAKLVDDPSVAVALQRYAEELRHVRPHLSGEALLDMGVPQGPLVGEFLAKLKDARLDGEVATEEDEIALARQLLLQNMADSP